MNTAWRYELFDHLEIQQQFQSVATPDPAFGVLMSFYDEKTVLSHLAEPLREHQSFEIDYALVLNVRHIFGKRFQVVYQAGNKQNSHHSLNLSVHFYPQKRDGRPFQKNRFLAAEPTNSIDLPGWSAVAFVFPDDPALPALSRMIQPETAVHSLTRHCGLSSEQEQIDWKIFAYHPGERATILHRGADFRVIGKITRDRSVVATHQQMTALWHCPNRAFRMPRPTGLEEESGIRWESFLPGKRLESIFSNIDFTRFLEKTCEALVNLHGLHIDNLPLNNREVVLKRMKKKMIPRISASLSPLSQEIQAYFDCLLEKERNLPERKPVTIHGDLHTGNILIESGEITLIDFDALAMGDPAYDLALLGSRLFMLARVKGECIKEAADAVALLPDIYQAAGGASISDKTFAWYLAALLVGRQLKTCVRERTPDLGRLAPYLIRLSRRLLETGGLRPLHTTHHVMNE
ncbi:MAG: aminoglycoside phosphotransferase family protein [Nitrospiria bacterium]